MKKFFFILLVILMPIVAKADGSGKCGNNLTWTFVESTGTLTISGTGAMKDYSYDSHAPWYSYRSNILKTEIEDGVTSIGKYAFYNCSSLTSITISESVTSIGDYAFRDCSSLKEVHITDIAAWCNIKFNNSSFNPLYYAHHLYLNGKEVINLVIPDGVTSIGNYAFSYCSSLTSITIPDGVTSIGDYAFLYCSSFTSINIPDGVTSIGNGAFSGCSNLTSITIPESVTSIDDYAFRVCSSLTSITIPESVTSIGDYAFSGCSSLISITIGKGVTSIGDYAFQDCSSLSSITIPEGVISIGDYAFSDCSSLTSITIPDGVTSIGKYAFSDCCSLTSINIGKGVTSIDYMAFSGCSNLTSITIPESVTSIDDYAFRVCSSLTSITIPESVTSIGNDAFLGCSSLKEVHITDIAAWCNITFVDYYSNPLSNAHHLYLNGKEVINLVIPDGVTSIHRYAFSNCSSLTSITIPDGVTSIGESAFYGCSSLTSINIPEGVTSIGTYAFYNCSSLTSITIPDGVTSIGKNAFEWCSRLKEVHITDIAAWCNIKFTDSYSNPLSYAHHLYLNGKEVINLVIPEGVTSIGTYAFYNCSNLTSITIPDGVTSIGYYAFKDCSNLKEVYITDIAAWCNIKFNGSYSNPLYYAHNLYLNGEELTNLVIPDNLKSINNMAFRNCYSFTSITIPDHITIIEEGIFSGCKNVKNVKLPESLFRINQQAFYGCGQLETITIPESVEYIYQQAFNGCALKSVKVLAKNPPFAYDNTFSNYDGELWVPEESISSYQSTSPWSNFETFKNLTGVEIVEHITFADAKVKEICVANWDTNGDGELSMLEAEAVTDLGEVFKNNTEITSFDELQYFTRLTSIGDYAFDGCSNLTSITIPESVTSVGEWAFRGCSFREIHIPSSLTEIGFGAFAVQPGLVTITVDDNNPIYDDGLNNNAIFETATNTLIAGGINTYIPERITKIGNNAFQNCTGLTSVDLHDNIIEIGAGAFYNCSNLTTIDLPDNLKVIGQVAFAQSGLTSITTPEKLDSIGSLVFHNCEELTDVELNARAIFSSGLFGGCTNLKNIKIGQAVKSIPHGAFFARSFGNGSSPQNVNIVVDSRNTVYDSRNNCNAIIETATNTLIQGSDLTSMPDNVTRIGESAFSWCTYLTSITIPKSVKSIGDYAFCNCSSLTSITIPDGVTSIGDWTFVGCTSLTSINIPESVTSIGYYAFRYCSSLTSITIPESVTSIGDEAFYKCSSLTSVTMGASTPVDITSDVFSNRTNATLYVPYGSKEAYMAASYWSEFKEIVEYGRPTGITITINQYGSSTYCSEFPLDFTNVEGLKAYVAGGFNTSTKTVMMYKVNTTKGNTGLFIKGTPGEYVVPVLESSDDNYMNMLVGTTEQVTVNSKSADGNYVNFKYTIKSGDQKPRFYEFTDGSTLSANKAYLQVPASWLPVTSEARTMNIMFDDEDVTGIEENYEFNMNSDGSVYDLSGCRVNNPTKGMYIVNGKKVVIK